MSRDKELWSSCLFTSLSQQPDSSHTPQTKTDGFRESQEKSVSLSSPYAYIYLCPHVCLFLSFTAFLCRLSTFVETKLLNFIVFTIYSICHLSGNLMDCFTAQNKNTVLFLNQIRSGNGQKINLSTWTWGGWQVLMPKWLNMLDMTPVSTVWSATGTVKV